MTRTELNSYKRAKRLEERKKALSDARCLNCEMFLAESIQDRGRVYKYCRSCITSGEAENHRVQRYYVSRRDELLPIMRKRSKLHRFKTENTIRQSTQSLNISKERLEYLRNLSIEEGIKDMKVVKYTRPYIKNIKRKLR